jgi:hypothetical protein
MAEILKRGGLWGGDDFEHLGRYSRYGRGLKELAVVQNVCDVSASSCAFQRLPLVPLDRFATSVCP